MSQEEWKAEYIVVDYSQTDAQVKPKAHLTNQRELLTWLDLSRKNHIRIIVWKVGELVLDWSNKVNN